MIKINLLPAYIIERRVVRRLMNMFVVFAILLIFGVVGVTYGYYGRHTALVKKDLQQNWAAGRDEAQDLKSKISRLETDQESRLNVFLNFKDEVDKKNRMFPEVLAMLNEYIFKAVVGAEMELENDQFKLKARIDSNENLAKFYKNLRRCPALVPGSVKIEDVEEYPIERKGGEETSSTYRPGPGASGVSGPSPPPEFFSVGEAMPSGAWFDPSTGTFTRRIPRSEYEFNLTATLMPKYALAPPTSPLAAAAETTGYGAEGAVAKPSGAPPSPERAPSAATGRRQLREGTDE